jgi:3-hydroxybutyrate dehydrogenase
MKPAQTIMITGAAGGIGLALARTFAASAHRVIACDLTEEALSLAFPDSGRAHSIVPVAFDLASSLSILSLREQLCGAAPDILINNAGLQHVAPLEEFPPEKWQQLVAVMLTGTALLTSLLIPGMRARGFGRIINIGSIHSLVASPFKSAYVAAKHGLLGFSKTLALETHDTDITVNTICPSYIMTPLVERQIEALAAEHGLSRRQVIDEIMLKPMPKKRFIEVQEISAAIAFLSSADARNMTGQCITIDGGWTAQ